MTPQTRARWKVVVIVEDDTDGRALRSLATAAGLGLDVDWLPANGIGNIKRRCAELIVLANGRVRPGEGCVAVVVDRDGKDASRDQPHRSIAQACRASDTPYLEAVEAFEAWALADPGVAAWLDLKVKGQTDRIVKPKKRVSDAFLKKAGRTFHKRRARLQLVDHATGIQPSTSPSWDRVVDLAARCPTSGDAD